jgi:hypothetical protein
MKERPIIFSAESVRAILDGRKTQTRRVVAKQDKPGFAVVHSYNPDRFAFRYLTKDSAEAEGCELIDGELKCPYGAPGDRLWVREAWRIDIRTDETCFYRADFRAEKYAHLLNWRSPMFMPRKFSRLTLEIVNVRCERLKDISVRDRLAEGYVYFDSFVAAWDALNKKRGFGWDTSPWVWVLEFKLSKGVWCAFRLLSP